MTQHLYIHRGEGWEQVVYPDPSDVVVHTVQWGRAEELLTPAYWAHRCALHHQSTDPTRFRMGSTLREEFAVCMLAGFGVPAEVGIAAAERLQALGFLLEGATPSQQDIENALREPLRVGERSVRYRFFRTKAKYLARGLQALQESSPDEAAPLAFRAWFRELPGVGPKTASFITRNWLGSDHVAILDVHVVRACQIVGLFPQDADLARDYAHLERLFLEFARGLGVAASWLDAVIWDDMRDLNDDIVGSAMDSSLERHGVARSHSRDKRVTSPVG